ncbi:MAG: sarcosine oxidase subunit gamma [Rhodothermales bacterium]|jgi:sarcosine oxidase subunit gamma
MPEHPGFKLKQIEGRSIVRLRIRPDGADSAREALKLPSELQIRVGDPAAIWQAPDQWLIISDAKPAEELVAQIQQALATQLYAATDMSSGSACFSLQGPSARRLLAMGCGIDMHPGVFKTGQCVRTHFANIALQIVAVDDNGFDLYIDRSLARYLADWLATAGEDPITLKSNSTSG